MSTQTEFVDYIIVGQGLAGSCMVLQLLKRKKKFVIIDKPDEHSATRVAAGLFNPITGRQFSKTWKADELFPYLHQFYRQAEEITGNTFFFPMPLYRPFLSVEEQNEWMGKSADNTYADFVEQVYTTPFHSHQVHNPLGGLLLKQCGFLHTHTFSESVRTIVQQQGCFVLNEYFDETLLSIQPESVQYRHFTAKKIILCQGEYATSGSLFGWLPIRPLKGETLTLTSGEEVHTIYNRGVYLVPGIWKVGATYDARDTSRTITQKGFEELSTQLKELIAFPYSIISQSWGMRPTTPDRKPLLGAHPEHQNIIIFNGLGTKGVSLAPYFSQVLLRWLENNEPINKEVDIHRYKQYYYAGNPLR